MFRSLLCKSGLTLKRTTTIINGESSSSSSSLSAPPAKYFLFTAFQNQNVVISNSRVYTTAASNSFVVSYLINSCGLSVNQAVIASKQINFNTPTKPDSVMELLKSYGFTQPYITKLICKRPPVLTSNPHETLKPKLDFFNSKGLYGIQLANFISNDPSIMWYSFNKGIVPSFDILKSVVLSDENIIKMIRRTSWVLSTDQAKRVMVNVEHLRKEGVPETFIRKYLIQQPTIFTRDADGFKDIVEKVKDMGFHHLESTFLLAIRGLTFMTEANWRKKMDVYKRWGWSEDQIQSAFRKYPACVMVSEKKIMAVMNFLVNEMGYDSSCIAEDSRVFSSSLKDRIIPRCYVIKILLSKGLIKEKISLSTQARMVDQTFLAKYVKKFEQEVPELMKVFNNQLNYQDLLHN